jgi:hypothetical protein
MIGKEKLNGSTNPWNWRENDIASPMFFRGFLGETRGMWPVSSDHPKNKFVQYTLPEAVTTPAAEKRAPQPMAHITPVIDITT